VNELATLGLAMGAAWVSGLRLYACVTTLGLLGRFGLVQLPGNLAVLSDWWVIGVAGVLFLVEFFADKIAWLDTGWDAVHTFIRIPAGAALVWGAYAHADSRVQIIAALLGGGLAFASHGVKASVRVAVNHSPEPVSNVFVSLAEDAGAAGLTALAVWLPLVALVVVVLAFVGAVVTMRKIVSAIGSLYGRRSGTSKQA
jgi:hypothetical protein